MMCWRSPKTPPSRGSPTHRCWKLAASEGRVLITRNSRDFAPLARQWAQNERSHAGIVLIWTLDHSQFAEIVAGVERQLRQPPSHEGWVDITSAF